MPLLSQKTPVRPMQPQHTIPGPVTEGPAKPGTSGNGVPINADLTGTPDNMTFVNYHPFTKEGPAKPLTAQPSGGDKGHARRPRRQAGQDKKRMGMIIVPHQVPRFCRHSLALFETSRISRLQGVRGVLDPQAVEVVVADLR
eukprot:1184164-Pyramimonas_sp.AAC.1